MKKNVIKNFHFTEVIVPAKEGMISSKSINKPLHMLPVIKKASDGWSAQFDELPKLIVRMELENGIIGLGEFYRDHNLALVESIAESLIGVDLNDLSLRKLPIGLYREYDGFECAIWDAYAKAHELRVVDLLGGPLQDKVKVGSWSSHREVSEVGAVAKNFADMGYDSIKFKADLEDDVVATCEEIKKAAPHMTVIFDPNQRWENLGETKKIVRDLEKVGNVFCLEDPIPFWMIQDYATLREFTDIKIVRHVSLPYIYQGQRIHDVINILNHRSADGFNFNAGLAKFQQQDLIANAANMYSWHGSEIDLGILEAMYIHQVSATENCIWPSDIFGRLIRSHDLLKTPLKIEAPYAYLPEGLGLGIELDEEVIESFKTNELFVG
ncbi:MAG: mandelate racemase/muconate lactonizing enzyme family protein [Campylobacteraceae bacterium]|nr:mandelate racemase/muconate lactonizing enzyme family protein [Campylobacteraceae bacterium]